MIETEYILRHGGNRFLVFFDIDYGVGFKNFFLKFNNLQNWDIVAVPSCFKFNYHYLNIRISGVLFAIVIFSVCFIAKNASDALESTWK